MAIMRILAADHPKNCFSGDNENSPIEQYYFWQLIPFTGSAVLLISISEKRGNKQFLFYGVLKVQLISCDAYRCVIEWSSLNNGGSIPCNVHDYSKLITANYIGLWGDCQSSYFSSPFNSLSLFVSLAVWLCLKYMCIKWRQTVLEAI